MEEFDKIYQSEVQKPQVLDNLCVLDVYKQELKQAKSSQFANLGPPGLVSTDKVEKYGKYSMELNQALKARVSIRQVGRIGGGFMGSVSKP